MNEYFFPFKKEKEKERNDWYGPYGCSSNAMQDTKFVKYHCASLS